MMDHDGMLTILRFVVDELTSMRLPVAGVV
jgi:hypothetical protein